MGMPIHVFKGRLPRAAVRPQPGRSPGRRSPGPQRRQTRGRCRPRAPRPPGPGPRPWPSRSAGV